MKKTINLAQQLIAQAKANNSKTLDLGYCNLTEIPKEVFELTQLEELYFCDIFYDYEKGKPIQSPNKEKGGKANHLHHIPKEMNCLVNLKKLFLNGNHNNKWSISKIENLDKLINLEILYLHSNKISELENLESLISLQILHISSNQISKLENLESLTNLQRLNLVSNQIFKLENLASLTSLQELNLSGNKIVKLEKLASLTSLQELNLNKNKIGKLENIDDLPSLQKLNLSENEIVKLENLGSLTSLQELNLNGNKISKLENLESLTSLQELNLSENKISKLENLDKLLNLKNLQLYSNQIQKIENLDKLIFLKHLELDSNQIRKIENLDKLVNLEHVELQSNQIVKLENLEKLISLQTLNLHSNQIVKLENLEKLISLQSLDISSNKIGEISSLVSLQKIKGLNISNNQICDINITMKLPHLQFLGIGNNPIKNLQNLRYFIDQKFSIYRKQNESYGMRNFIHSYQKAIFVKDNPLICPLPELISETGDNTALIEYFNSIEKGSKPLNEVKILLVGEGGAGKTSLVKVLTGEDYNSKEDQTHGVRIKHDKIKIKKEDITLHYWDFGGQEVMHATHQFFLSKRSLYVLVIDSRKNSDSAYWLEHIRTYGANSPVFIVINKIEDNPVFDLDETKIRRSTTTNIIGFYKVSCETGKGIAEFQKALYEQIYDMPLRATPFSSDWLAVKNELLEYNLDNIDYISSDEFEKICKKNHIENTVTQNVLLELLNDLGISLHYAQLTHYNTQILNPLWLTNAVYRIINSRKIAEEEGVVKLEEITDVLNSIDHKDEKKIFEYKKRHNKFIIDIMREFELCYEIEREVYIIPNLLPKKEPEIADFDEENAAKVKLDYGFLPHAVFIRLLVKLNELSDPNYRWHSGAMFHYPLHNQRALVRIDTKRKELWIFSDKERRQQMIEVIEKKLTQIHSEFENMTPKKLIPLPDGITFDEKNKIVRYEADKFVSFDVLKRKEKAGEKIHKNWEVDSMKEYNIRELLNGIESVKEEKQLPPLNVFVVYSKEDDVYFKEFNKHLKMKIVTSNINVSDNNNILAGEMTKQALEKRFKEADIMICLISADFFTIRDAEFPFINSLYEVIKNYNTSEKKVVPLQVRACEWKKSELGVLHPLNNNPIKNPKDDEQWLEIIKKLDQVILELNRSKYPDHFKKEKLHISLTLK